MWIYLVFQILTFHLLFHAKQFTYQSKKQDKQPPKAFYEKATLKCFAIFTEKDTSSQVLSCKYTEIFKNTYFKEHLRMAASESRCSPWFFPSNFFGKPVKDRDGNVIQILNTIQKIGDPNFQDFGQHPDGGLSKIDQRQLNMLYCQHARAAVMKDELQEIIKHSLSEYDGSPYKEYSNALKLRLSKIYNEYYFAIAEFNPKASTNEWGIWSNGNCAHPTIGFGRQVVLCWARKDSFNMETQATDATKVFQNLRLLLQYPVRFFKKIILARSFTRHKVIYFFCSVYCFVVRSCVMGSMEHFEKL